MEQEELNMRTQLNMKNIIGEKKEWKIEALGDVDAKEMEFRRMFSGIILNLILQSNYF